MAPRRSLIQNARMHKNVSDHRQDYVMYLIRKTQERLFFLCRYLLCRQCQLQRSRTITHFYRQTLKQSGMLYLENHVFDVLPAVLIRRAVMKKKRGMYHPLVCLVRQCNSSNFWIFILSPSRCNTIAIFLISSHDPSVHRWSRVLGWFKLFLSL